MDKNFSRLPNGLTVATVEMPGFETVAVGAFVGVGSRYEPIEINGIAHFCEHMAFKGTPSRSAYDIAYAAESVGARINAYTSKENTAYHITCAAEHLDLSLDIIADVVQRSSFPIQELERERGVVLQEMARSYDDPSGLVWELFDTTAYPDQAYGRTILGKESVIENISRDDFLDYFQKFYTASNIIVVCAGKIKHEDFVKKCEDHFGDLHTGEKIPSDQATHIPNFGHFNKNFEQANVVLGFPTVNMYDDEKFVYGVASKAFGGGMSSPLFTEVREKRGLVYSVGSASGSTHDHGDFYVYAGCSPDKLTELFEVITDELLKSANLFKEEDIFRAKNQFKSGMLMSLESPMAQASGLVSMVKNYGKVIPVEETIAKIDAVTAEDCQRVFTKMLAKQPSLQIVGNVTDDHYSFVVEKLS